MKKLVRCFECDSEYIIDFRLGELTDEPQYCMVCKEVVELEDIEEDE